MFVCKLNSYSNKSAAARQLKIGLKMSTSVVLDAKWVSCCSSAPLLTKCCPELVNLLPAELFSANSVVNQICTLSEAVRVKKYYDVSLLTFFLPISHKYTDNTNRKKYVMLF